MTSAQNFLFIFTKNVLYFNDTEDDFISSQNICRDIVFVYYLFVIIFTSI